VFNYYFDEARDGHADTVMLFDEIKAGKYDAYTSVYATDELLQADEPKRSDMVALISHHNIIVLPGDEEVDRLSGIYINEGVVPASKRFDSLHISVATVSYLDYIFSFDFKHINRIKTKQMTSIINVREGYRPITIASPSEV